MKVIIDIPEIPTNDHQRWALANGTPYAHGEWKRNPQSRTLITRTCTLCGGRSAVGNFCMWCGAEMRMKEDEANENHN